MSNLGRPTDYRPEYDQAIIDHMATGMSYESFAGRIRVNRDTLYHWEKLHPSFSDAKKIAREAQLFANEGRLHDMAKGKIKGCNVTAQIFIMKNSHGWTDKLTQEIDQQTITIAISPTEKDL